MSTFRTYDAFAKPIDGLRTQTTSGGIITVLATAFSGLLFLSQIFLYFQAETRHSFRLAESISSPLLPGYPHPRPRKTSNRKLNHISINFRVTFPHIKCEDLDVLFDDSHRKELNIISDFHTSGKPSLTKKVPSHSDLRRTPFGWNGAEKAKDGCTIMGRASQPAVGGTVAITISIQAWNKITRNVIHMDGRRGLKLPDMYNVSHFIHSFDFGNPFPLATNPLSSSAHIFTSDSGLGLSNIAVKIIPTAYKRFARGTSQTHQLSVTQHMVATKTLAQQGATIYPGMLVSYDFSPLQVHHTERRENFFLFLSGLVSIVGGVFVVVGALGKFLVSAVELAKKKD